MITIEGKACREHRLEILPPNGKMAEMITGHFPKGFRGHAMDIGASDGVSINSTYMLERQGWRVICVEPNPELSELALKHRFSVERCACGSVPDEAAEFHVNISNPESHSALSPDPEKSKGINNWVTFKTKVRTIDQLLEKWEYDKLDAICIDVEGAEIDVLKGCDLAKWRPKVIVVEAWEEGQHDAYLNDYGYHRQMRSWDNDLYVKDKR